MSEKKYQQTIILEPNAGRKYQCGPMVAIFKLDEEETDSAYAVSEWWLEPNTSGPGIHHHEKNEELFYVIEGTASFIIDGARVDASKGTCIRIPANVSHDFENKTDKKTGILNFFMPGGFESNMPAIVRWFENQK